MDLRVTIDHGALKAEIDASEDEDYANVLDDLAQFLEDHPQLASPPKTEVEMNGQDAKNGAFQEENKTTPDTDAEAAAVPREETIKNEMLRPLLSRIDVSEGDFIRTFEVDEEVTPRILEPDALPEGSVGEKILNASIVITTIWQECYGEDWLKTSDLSDALEQSGLKDRTDYIYNQENWQSLFNKDGDGRGTKIKATRLGKDRAEELIEEMAK